MSGTSSRLLDQSIIGNCTGLTEIAWSDIKLSFIWQIMYDGTLNPTKTEAVIFGTSQQLSQVNKS